MFDDAKSLYSKSSFEITDVSLKFEAIIEDKFKFVLVDIFEHMASLEDENESIFLLKQKLKT